MAEPLKITVRPAEAVLALSISERTLRDLMRSGEIPFSRLDRAILIRVADLDTFVARRSASQESCDG
ncbi:MAG: helix-turn-helix domain-containing protein [Phycisphaerales bacterium]